jgi:hypothetical protein
MSMDAWNNERRKGRRLITRSDLTTQQFDGNTDPNLPEMLGTQASPVLESILTTDTTAGDYVYKQNLWSYGITKEELVEAMNADSPMTVSLMHTHLLMLQVSYHYIYLAVNTTLYSTL